MTIRLAAIVSSFDPATVSTSKHVADACAHLVIFLGGGHAERKSVLCFHTRQLSVQKRKQLVLVPAVLFSPPLAPLGVVGVVALFFGCSSADLIAEARKGRERRREGGDFSHSSSVRFILLQCQRRHTDRLKVYA